MKSFLVFALAGSASAAFAGGYVHNSLGPLDEIDPNGLVIAGTNSQDQFGFPQTSQFIANDFVADGGGQLTRLTLGIGHWSGTDEMRVTLYQDDPGSGVFGAMMASWDISGLPAFPSGGLFTITNTDPSVQFVQGERYWVALSQTATGEAMNNVWNWSVYTAGVSSWGLSYDGGASWYSNDNLRMMAMRVEAVPEPASLAVLAIGAGALARRRRRAG